MRSRKAKVRLEDSFRIIALLDTIAEINIMTREIIEDIGLAMHRGSKFELVSHTDHSYLFAGFCKDTKVTTRGLKTKHLIFVIEHGNYNLVLGQLFLNLV